MKPLSEWRSELTGLALPDTMECQEGRSGDPTLKIGDIFLHSRYRPREEAKRLIDSAGLDLNRPVLVVGLGLGYHVLELLERGATVAVVEADRAVASLALRGPLADVDFPLGLGDPNAIAASDGFQTIAAQTPQLLIHPASARIHPQFAEGIAALAAKATLSKRRLSIAVVGPMFGGSLPIAGYLERAFGSLGHRTLYVDNSRGWDLYDAMTKSVKGQKTSGQLGGMLVNFLAEWSYAQVAEFAPDICIVIAQAPVDNRFPARLAQAGIVSAFWYMENWRHLPYWQEIAPLYDSFFHIQPGEFEQELTRAGCRHHAFVQTGCDPEIHKPVELSEEDQTEFGCDISFAGAGYYNRNQVFAGLTDYDFALWGVDWSHRNLDPLVRKPNERFTPETFAKMVAASKITLNLHSSTSHPGIDPNCDAINPRVFEIAACGGFQLCDPCKGLENYFDFESELPVYRDLHELRQQIDYYLAHPDERQAIAQRARERALSEHTYEKRAQQMLDLILERHGARILKKGVLVQRTIAEVANDEGRDSELGQFLSTLPGDILFTQENITEHIDHTPHEVGHAEGIFDFLRELRDSSESLLDERGEG
jgi:spore maturation protein CgeB